MSEKQKIFDKNQISDNAEANAIAEDVVNVAVADIAEPEEEVEARSEGPRACVNSSGACTTPVREVPSVVVDEAFTGTESIVLESGVQSTRWAEGQGEEDVDETDGTPSARAISTGASATPVRGVHSESVFVGNVAANHDPSGTYDVDIYDTDAYTPTAPVSVYTRATDPFNPARVAEVLRLVQLGPDLTEEQRLEVRALVESYADIFALAVSEVCPVKGAVYAPKIPMDHKFSTKVHQRPVTQPQAEYLHQQVEVMVKAGIIRPIHPRDVKCVSPIKLAQKEH
ncbi:hypothetical protein C8R44DRAFT_631037, partial [Mycena epipterygia]